MALVDGEPGAAVILGGQLRIALLVSFADDRIAAIEAVADEAALAEIDLEVL